MLFGKKKEIEETVSTVIGEDTLVKGEISTKGSIHIGGEFEGKLQAAGDIFAGEGSKIKGNLFGERVVVAGEVHGNIVAQNGLEIMKTGKVYGDVTGERLVVDEGAVYKGKVNMEAIGKKESEEVIPEAKPQWGLST